MQFGRRVNDSMWAFFFLTLGVIDASGEPTPWFGNVRYVYAKYRQAKGDPRTVEEIISDPLTAKTVASTRRSRMVAIFEVMFPPF